MYDKGQTCEMAKYCADMEVWRRPPERNDEQKTKSSSVEHSAPSVHIKQMSAEQANALLLSHINTINITHTICLEQSGLGQASRAHSEC